MPSLQELISGLQPLTSLSEVVPGDVLSFKYTLYRRDPYPVVLMLEDQGSYIFGVNLHYLTFPVIQEIFRQFGSGSIPTYEALNNIPNIRRAFRKYKKSAIRQPRVKVLADILRQMMIPRVYPEHEIRRAREAFQQEAEAPAAEENNQGLSNPMET